MDYFKHLADLLKIEREEDRSSYQALAKSSSLSERRADGLAWYPVAIRDSELGRGDYLTVEVERTTHLDILHQLRPGAPAAFFSNHDATADRIEGTISFVGGHRLRITLPVDELPEWTRNGKLGIDLLFDDNSYTEMFGALKKAAAALERPDEGRLVRILTGRAAPVFTTGTAPGSPFPGSRSNYGEFAAVNPATPAVPTHFDPSQQAAFAHLNSSQQAAIEKILSAEDLAIVHGPPGTGKTTTLVQAILAIHRRDGEPILVTAPSNTAVDLLSERLSELGLTVLRIGNPARVSERLQSLTLDSRIAEHPGAKEIKKLKRKAAEFRDMAHKCKRNFGPAEREQRKALFDEARNLQKDVDRIEGNILGDLLSGADVITATLVSANHPVIRHREFSTVVIDEAGQALEPASWIPALKARRLILGGDHCQLPPTVKSRVAAEGGLSGSPADGRLSGSPADSRLSGSPADGGLARALMERNILLHPEAVVLLEQQYRMHELIMSYPSLHFYESRLRADPSVAARRLFEEDSPLTFIDTAGCGYEETRDDGGISNPEEAAFLLRHAAGFVSILESRFSAEDFPTMAIISPYRLQVQLLQELIPAITELKRHNDKITVNTIDSFQGQERDIVYIGLTRSNSDNRIGFLSEIRRMNVAMTRARKKLVVVGDSATLAQTPFYAGFIEFAERHDAYKSAWDFLAR
ncbi:MAG TPA: AAA domain-containing protein [Puia sp.]|nr:AAA domain-containing protein [Puia sp.]